MGYARVLLADDHPDIREAVAALLNPEFDIVGSVTNGRDGLAAVLSLKPDILITDISMPILDGIQLAFQLRDLGCTTKIIFLTVHSDRDYLEAAFSAGVVGYVLKSNIVTDLLSAIQAALEGRQFTSDCDVHRNYV